MAELLQSLTADMRKNHQPEAQEDRALIARVQQNPEEFKAIVEQYWDRLFRFVRRISSFTNEDIEDILQETFVKAYRNLNSFSGAYKLSTWLYQIARTTTIDAFRKTKARPHTVSLDGEEALKIAFSQTEAAHTLDQKKEAEKLQTVIAGLPLKYQEVLILRFIEEKTYEEIVDIVKKPAGTVASLIQRGRTLVRNQMNL